MHPDIVLWERRIRAVESDTESLSTTLRNLERDFREVMAKAHGLIRGLAVSITAIAALMTVVASIFGWILLEKNNDIKQMQSVLYQAVTAVAVTQAQLQALTGRRAP